METILIDYDLYKFIDRSYPAPMATITANNKVQPKPKYLSWFRQDKLLFGALVGIISPSLIPMIIQS